MAGKAFAVYGYHVFLIGYEPGGKLNGGEGNETQILASNIANYDLMPVTDGVKLKKRTDMLAVLNALVGVIFWMARVINPVLLVLAIIGAVRGFVLFFAECRRDVMSLLISTTTVGLLTVSYAYAFMIMLFCTQYTEYFPMAERMYSVGDVSVLTLIMVLGGAMLFRDFSSNRKHSEGLPAKKDRLE